MSNLQVVHQRGQVRMRTRLCVALVLPGLVANVVFGHVLLAAPCTVTCMLQYSVCFFLYVLCVLCF